MISARENNVVIPDFYRPGCFFSIRNLGEEEFSFFSGKVSIPARQSKFGVCCEEVILGRADRIDSPRGFFFSGRGKACIVPSENFS